MDISDDISLLTDLPKNFPLGSALRAHVLSVDVDNNRLDMSARPSKGSTALTMEDLSQGMVLLARVTKVTDRHIMVQLSDTLSAPVHLVDMADDFSTANPAKYHKNQKIRVCVSNIDKATNRITLSTRPSKVLSSSLQVKDPEIILVSQLKINDVVRGFIKNVADNGIFITLASNITAFTRISDLSDAYIKDWKAKFQIDQLVRGKIIALDPLVHHIQMSLKESVLDANYKAPKTYADIIVGQVVTGRVRKVEDFGVFIVLDDSANVSGLCHRSEMAETRITNIKELYDEGDAVKAKVLKVNREKRQISLGLKASYFQLEQDTDGNSDESDDMNGVGLSNHVEDGLTDEDMEDIAKIPHIPSDGIHTAGSGNKSITPAAPAERIPLALGHEFDWVEEIAMSEAKVAESDAKGNLAQETKRKRKRAEIKIDKTGDLDVNGPQSVADFERLLMGQPNSSELWLSYIDFQLNMSEIDKAREVADRATRTINHQIRETDNELLYVWEAFLRLENTFGNDETLEAVFKRACEYNDAGEIHSRLASIYIKAGKKEVGLFLSAHKFYSINDCLESR
jgi:rRNA biogenesis protein RRP5